MRYPRVSLYALMLATAGIPLYIHLPRYASVQLDIGLAALGVLLLLIRVFDFIQDPLLGWVADRWPAAQPTLALAAAAGLVVGFPLLFSLQPGMFWQMAALLALLFTSYSLGTILIYGRSEILARSADSQELLKLAGWREAGQLSGVIIAAAAPSALMLIWTDKQAWLAFGLLLAVVALTAACASRPIWRRLPSPAERPSGARLSESGAMRLLALVLLNSLPVALTSTLFLFFAEDHLELTGRAGFFLLLFFMSAGLGIPVWSFVSAYLGNRLTLVVAMGLAVVSFAGAAFIGPRNATGFLLICAGSGFATGADILILPLMFSKVLIRAGLNASSAFGIWTFAGKLAVAISAATALPFLETTGFIPGSPLTPDARTALIGAYAVAPCILKLFALGFTLTLPKEEMP